MFVATQQRDMFLVGRNYTLLRDGEGLPDIDGDELDFYLTLWDLFREDRPGAVLQLAMRERQHKLLY